MSVGFPAPCGDTFSRTATTDFGDVWGTVNIDQFLSHKLHCYQFLYEIPMTTRASMIYPGTMSKEWIPKYAVYYAMRLWVQASRQCVVVGKSHSRNFWGHEICRGF
jgi:hypothetical protein